MTEKTASTALAPRAEMGTVRAPEPDVTSLVQLALEQKMPVEVLERLVALQERVSDRNARAAFVAALSRVQEECPPIGKSKTAQIKTRSGGSYSYTYAPLDRIAQTIRPVLALHGFSYSWDSQVEGGMVETTCTLRHVEGHSEKATFSAPAESDAAMSGAQKHAAALTFGRRQSLVQVLGLTTTDDDVEGGGPGGGSQGGALTEGQAADVRALIREVGADEKRFLRWLQVESVEDIPAARFREAISALEQKRRSS